MELADILQNVTALNEAGMTAVTVYLTVVTTYLIAAYVVGSELKSSQLAIVSILFVIFALIFSFGSFRLFYTAFSIAQSGTDGTVNIGAMVPYTVILVELFGIGAALKFMKDIRKDAPKK